MAEKRLYRTEDFTAVKEYIEAHNLNMPDYGMMFIEFSDEGKILGLINLRTVAFIEPLIADNPLAGYSLFKDAEKFLKERDTKFVRCITEQKNEAQFNRAGFKTVFPGMIIMEKDYGR